MPPCGHATRRRPPKGADASSFVLVVPVSSDQPAAGGVIEMRADWLPLNAFFTVMTVP
jgi:hypothetical protein